ncbi:MAG: glycosyltransferase family 2 protein [Candidatus Firestonebacteria bacterium]
MQKIAGVVVLYNPAEETAGNINSYAGQVDVLFAIDNSDNADNEIIEKIKKLNNVVYIKNDGNEGIAKALNIASKRAIDAGADYLVTMDQDDSLPGGYVLRLLECFKEKTSENAGIIAPYHKIKKNQYPETGACLEVVSVMMSGNILKLSAYQKTGLFNEDLFIDYVDHEYCLRLALKGYKIIQAGSVVLNHKIGRITRQRFFFRFIHTTNHPPIRRYYTTRNRLYICAKFGAKFPEFCTKDKKEFIIELFKVFCFERQKISKLKMMLRGYRDFKEGKFGKYAER